MRNSRIDFEIEPLERRVMLAFQRVGDLPAYFSPSVHAITATVGETVFFVNNDGTLSATVGEATGIQVLRRFSASPSDLTVFKDKLFFTANDAEGSAGLWVTDGTPAGTSLVKSDGGRAFHDLLVADGHIFLFRDSSDAPTSALWISDGTPSGTKSVATIDSAVQSAAALGNGLIINTSDTVYVGGTPIDTKASLYRYDSTTSKVTSIGAGPWESIASLSSVGDQVLFEAVPLAGTKDSLWVTDGTSTGTQEVSPGKDMVPILDSGQYLAAGARLFYSANSLGDLGGSRLWVSDGTAAGTHLVSTSWHYPRSVVTANGPVFFTANDQAMHARIYRTDGTETGTTQLLSGSLTVDSQFRTFEILVQGDHVLFDSRDNSGSSTAAVWVARSTGGARQLKGLPDSKTTVLAATSNALYFAYDDGIHTNLQLGEFNTNVGWLSGSIFNDSNMNGSRDSGEAGIGSARVFVDLNGDGVREKKEPSAWTSSKGTYHIDDVPAGKRTLRMEHFAGYAATTNYIYHVTVPALGEVSKKFGVTPGGTIRGYVFNDLNANGVQDSGEAGLANFRVWIDLDKDGILDDNEPTAHTNSAGRYVIADLLPGNYRIRIKSKAGWASTTAKSFSFALSAASSSTKRFGVRSV